jgi:ATP/ADP translocase
MLKRGTVILGRFLQQILIVLLLALLVVFAVVGFILYPAPTALQPDLSQPLFVMPLNTPRGQSP